MYQFAVSVRPSGTAAAVVSSVTLGLWATSCELGPLEPHAAAPASTATPVAIRDAFLILMLPLPLFVTSGSPRSRGGRWPGRQATPYADRCRTPTSSAVRPPSVH